MKYKALIADDEMLARYSLKTLISKNMNDLSVVGEAENGRQAIELAKAFGSEQSSRFVNGVLDGILKSRTFPGSLT